ncbi:MAG TPA: DUF4249 domain-containing protein [Cyclobacteriaceae bacterium]|nr:DUF4249 domain-containing protein [Cyclobacteriaceae bacterium]
MNRKAPKPVLIIVSISLLVMNCVPDPIPVNDIPKLQTQIVVSSQILPNQSVSVFLTKSIGALDAGRGSDVTELINEIVINDAVVTLEHDGKIYNLGFVGSGAYAGSNIPLSFGKSYTLQVKSPAFGEVTSTTVAPRQVPFNSVDASLYQTGYDSLAQVKYALTDPPEKNYYMVNVQKFSRKQNVNSLLNPRLFIHLVKDDDFNGKEYNEEFKVFFQKYSKGDTVAVFMSNISPEYFKYLSLRNDNRYNLAGFASEPLNYPTNVQGGYGYFNLHVPDVRIFVME